VCRIQSSYSVFTFLLCWFQEKLHSYLLTSFNQSISRQTMDGGRALDNVNLYNIKTKKHNKSKTKISEIVNLIPSEQRWCWWRWWLQKCCNTVVKVDVQNAASTPNDVGNSANDANVEKDLNNEDVTSASRSAGASVEPAVWTQREEFWNRAGCLLQFLYSCLTQSQTRYCGIIDWKWHWNQRWCVNGEVGCSGGPSGMDEARRIAISS